MVSRMALWNIFRNNQPVIVKDIDTTPTFDRKYISIVSFPTTAKDTEKMRWVNDNTSKRSVDVKFVGNMVYMAFEDENDALIFKIRYL